MRNITLLLCLCIGIILWGSRFFLSKEDATASNEVAAFDFNQPDEAAHFDVKKLAFILGVDYQKIDVEEVIQEPIYSEVELSLVAIYTSGDFAKVRLRFNDLTAKEVYFDAVQGAEFNSLVLSKIGTTYVEILNNGKTVLLKMYQPQIINIAKETNGEVVKND